MVAGRHWTILHKFEFAGGEDPSRLPMLHLLWRGGSSIIMIILTLEQSILTRIGKCRKFTAKPWIAPVTCHCMDYESTSREGIPIMGNRPVSITSDDMCDDV